MNELQGFWSYVHADDDAEGGRITQLAKDVASQYEMLTGESINLFLDKDAIDWGDDWRKRIGESLASVAFFIPVLTPRYFMSPECRAELGFFARKASELGIKDLLLPLLYVDIPNLDNDPPSDELMARVTTFQRQDWRDLRYKDRSSEEYRKAVARLAERLVEANRKVELAGAASTDFGSPEDRESHSESDSPGIVDRLARAEEALPEWQTTLEQIGIAIEEIGRIMQDATVELQSPPPKATAFAHRLAVARRMARDLEEPTEHVCSFGNEFVSHLNDVDDGIRTIIGLAKEQLAEHPESKDDVCQFFARVKSLSSAASRGLNSVQEMIEAIAPIERISRDLRPPLRHLRQGLTVMVEGRRVSDEWVDLIDGSGIDCENNEALNE